MPTPTKGPRLGGSPAHQRLLLSNLATALFEHGKITTTHAKAKALRPLAEKLITFAKRGDIHARRQVLTVVRNKGVVHTLFAEIGPRFAERPGGYTRITKVGPRKGDNAPMATIELVEGATIAQQAVGEAERARGTRFARRRGSAAAASATAPVAPEAIEDDGQTPVPTEGDTEAPAATEAEQTPVPTEGDTEGGAADADAGAADGGAGEAPDADSLQAGSGGQADQADQTSQAEGEDA